MTDLDWAVEGLDPRLAAELTRVSADLGNEEDPTGYSLTSLQVLRCHYLVAEYFTSLGHGLSQPGLKSVHLLQSAVSRQHVGFAGHVKWNDLYHVTATLFFGLIKNHAFHDSNKRTALLSAFYQLQCHWRVSPGGS